MRDATLPQFDSVDAKSPYLIASALRTLHVLRAFCEPPFEFGLAEIVARLEMERNQAYRSLKTLEAAEFLESVDGARFRLGPAAATMATTAHRARNDGLLEDARPFLDRISDETGETVHLFLRSGDHAVCIDRRESTASVRLVSVLGRTFPLHAGATPKAILAHLPGAERDAVLDGLAQLPAYTDRTARDRDALERELATIREQGFARSDRDFDAAARGVGAPIFAADGTVIGGISVGGPAFRVNDQALTRFAKLARAAAREITRRQAFAGRS